MVSIISNFSKLYAFLQCELKLVIKPVWPPRGIADWKWRQQSLPRPRLNGQLGGSVRLSHSCDNYMKMQKGTPGTPLAGHGVITRFLIIIFIIIISWHFYICDYLSQTHCFLCRNRCVWPLGAVSDPKRSLQLLRQLPFSYKWSSEIISSQSPVIHSSTKLVLPLRRGFCYACTYNPKLVSNLDS
jgi:hypothetical protein